MKKKFSDLHCHNHMRAYLNMLTRQSHFEAQGTYSPWTVVPSNAKKNKKGSNSAAYSQTDLVRAWNAGLKLTFNALYPLERDFVRGKDITKSEDLLNVLFGAITAPIFPIRDLMQLLAMRIPKRTIDFFQSDGYDYWKTFRREFEFVWKDSGKRISKNEILANDRFIRKLDLEKRPANANHASYVATDACYRIPINLTELISSLADDNEITMILTIEGAHALGSDQASPAVVSQRIKEIKEDRQKWPAPIFFITFGHHFDNRLVGHAHSLPDKGNLIFNQSSGMNDPIPPQGIPIIQQLLGLNEQNQRDPNQGYRILIDVKHMSAASRKDYYEKIVRSAMQNGDIIPVIASHCGYSGLEDLNTHIKHHEDENDTWKGPKPSVFNAWNINMCDEDIQIILETHGLFGLSFDQRILGLEMKEDDTPRNSITLIWENLEGIIKASYSLDIHPSIQDRIWSCLTIGTDFEGLIDPVNPYPTVFDFDQLEKDLINRIDLERQNPKKNYLSFIQDRGHVVQLVRDFCFNNAENFVKKHYPV